MKKNKLLILAGSICAVLILAVMPFMSACAKPAPVKPIKIGALMPLTGVMAIWGEMYTKSFEFALDEAGWEVAGRPIEFIVEDEGGMDIIIALDKAKKLVEADKVDLILGPFYGGSRFSVLPYTSSVPIVNLVYAECSSNPDELGNKYAFFTALSYKDTTYPVGLYAYDEMGIRTVTTMAMDFSVGYDFIGGFTDALEARGGKVIQQQWYPLDEIDFAPYLSALKMADALVYAGGSPAGRFALFSQYDELGLFEKMPIINAEVTGMTEPVLQEIGDRTIGVIAPLYYNTTLDNPENKKFLPAYRAKYDEDPYDPTLGGYNCMRVALAALEATGGDTDPDKLKEALLKVELDLPAGHLKFCPGRVAIQNMHIAEVQKVNGTLMWVPIKTYHAVEPYIETYP